MKIGVFTGNDISSHLLLNKLVPRLKDIEFNCSIFCPDHVRPVISKRSELVDMSYLERDFLHERLYPYLENRNDDLNQNFTLHKLTQTYDITVEEVKNINNISFISILESQDFAGFISIRCYQKFRRNFLTMIGRTKKFLWNLHPGKLPDYKGVTVLIREMMNGEKFTANTLHKIDEGLDTGEIISQSLHELDYSKSVLANYIEIYPRGVDQIIDSLKNYLIKGKVNSFIQDKEKGNYYSYLTAKDLDLLKKKGIVLFSKKEYKSIIMKKYNLPEGDRLLQEAME